MANGVDVNIGADTRDFERSVKSGMQAPVEDAQKALDQYVDAASAGGEDLTHTFTAQQRSTTELKQDIDELNRTIREGSAPAYRKAGDSVDEFKHRSTEGFDEIKESARSNAIEVGASFTGGMDQAVGGLQGFLAEFLAGFGPGGVIAGVGIAALLGVISQGMADGQQAAEAQKAAVADLSNEYLDAGRTGRRTFENITGAIKSMATSDGSDVIITLQQAFEKAQRAGGDYQAIVQAIASGSPTEIARARAAVDSLGSAHLRVLEATGRSARGAAQANRTQYNANQDLSAALAKAEQQATDAGRAEKLAARAGLSDLSLKNDLLNQLQSGYDDTAGSADEYLNKEKTVLKVGPYIEAMEKRRHALIKYKNELAEADLDPAAKKFLESQGADAAAAMMAGYSKASPKQKAQLNEIWSTAGDTSADSYGAALGKKIQTIKPHAPKIPQSIVPPPDTSALDAFIRAPAIKRIVLEGVTRNGTRVF
jgi:hypothetical protein